MRILRNPKNLLSYIKTKRTLLVWRSPLLLPYIFKRSPKGFIFSIDHNKICGKRISEKLSNYLTESNALFYLTFLKKEGITDYDSYSQILQVISDKECQPKFISGTKAYKRNSIMLYALHENLKEFGWCLPLPPKIARTRSA